MPRPSRRLGAALLLAAVALGAGVWRLAAPEPPADAESVRLFLAGADPKATDWGGLTALDWAVRRGETDITRLLRASRAGESKPPATPDAPPLLMGADSPRRAVAAARPPLQRSGRTITETRDCVSCHHHPLCAGAGSRSMRRSPARSASSFRPTRARLRPLLLGTRIDPPLAAFVLAGMDAEGQPPSRVSDAPVHYHVLRQCADGRWKQETHSPPAEASDFQFAAQAARGLRAYAPPGRRAEVAARLDRARQWLEAAPPADVTDRAFWLLGLGWAGAGPDPITTATGALLVEQRPDGGWAQLPALPTDAFATGLALCALHQGGGVGVDHPAYGAAFLLRTQLANGSWLVRTRSLPVVDYTTSGIPHGRSQFISASATCWAAMALTVAVSHAP